MLIHPGLVILILLRFSFQNNFYWNFLLWLFLICLPLHISIASAFVHVCKHSGHHLVVYEGDYALFDAIISPIRAAKSITATSGFVSERASINSNEELLKKDAKRRRLNT